MKRSPSTARMLFPSAEPGEWELWRLDDSDEAPERITDPGSIDGGGDLEMALPCSMIAALPVVLPGQTPDSLAEAVGLELEMRGLTDGGTASWSWRSVSGTNPEQATAVAEVLDRHAGASGGYPDCRRYFPSALALPMAPRQLVLWREHGQLCMAVSGADPYPVYHQVLGARRIDGGAASELHCLLLELEAKAILAWPETAMDWTGDDPTNALTALGIPVNNAPRPGPVRPTQDATNLIPSSVIDARTRHRKRIGALKLAGAGAALYAAVVVLAAGYLGWLGWQRDRMERQVTELRPSVLEVETALSDWLALEPALDSERYPLEMLYRSARHLPEEGVRFTLFEQRDGRIMITGEASNFPAAFRYVEQLREDDSLAGFDWRMPQPRILPNNSAEFQITGVPIHASIN